MKKVAIITARGGSKRIPRKNIKHFVDRPLINFSIEECLKSQIFDEVMVSTDSEEIRDVALKAGASVPFFRSSRNSDDFSGTVDVLLEVLKSYENIGKHFDFFCCVYPTAPFITTKKLNESFDLLIKNQGDFCVSVTEYTYPVQRRLSLNSNNEILFSCPEFLMKRSQDLEKFFHDVGQIYWGKTTSLGQYKNVFAGKSLAYPVHPLEAQDIDNLKDWEIAEFKYKYLKNAGII
jgi:N-acylneuraminate cytidylyltransferase